MPVKVQGAFPVDVRSELRTELKLGAAARCCGPS